MRKRVSGVGFIGFGDLGRQIEGLLGRSLAGRRRTYFDDALYARRHPNAQPFDAYAHPRFSSVEFYVCLGYRHPHEKYRVLGRLRRLGRRTPAWVDRSCIVDPSALIGAGSLLFPGTVVGQNARVGEGAVLHQSVTLSHDVSIGDGAYVSPGAVVCGHSSVGTGAFIGAASVVADHLAIGDFARIGIGTVVTRPVAARASAIGYPMKLLRRPLVLGR